jgi:Ni/Co efflux regulator RcnB
MKKVIAILALAFFTLSMTAQEPKQEKKEMACCSKNAKKSNDEVAKCQAKCKAEGKKCDAKVHKASGKKC